MEEIRRDDEFGEDIEYIGRIKMQYASLSKSQKRIANYILNHREAVIHHSITTMAQKTGHRALHGDPVLSGPLL